MPNWKYIGGENLSYSSIATQNLEDRSAEVRNGKT